MEEQTPTTNNCQLKNRWRIIAIVFITATMLLAGTTAFFAIQNADNKAKADDAATNSKQSDNQADTQAGVEDEARFLIVGEWGMKFQVPDQFIELSYKIREEGYRLDFYGSIKPYGPLECFDVDHCEGSVYNFHTPDHPDSQGFTGSVIRLKPTVEMRRYCTSMCMKIGNHNGYNFYFGYGINNVYTGYGDWNFWDNLAWYLLDQMVSSIEFI